MNLAEKTIDKLAKLEHYVSKRRGEFALFAFFLREDEADKWDLLVSAPWIEKDKGAALRYLAGLIRSRFTVEESLSLSRIVIIDSNNPALQAIHTAVGVEHGKAEVINCDFFGLHIKHAYIFASKVLSQPVASGTKGSD